MSLRSRKITLPSSANRKRSRLTQTESSEPITLTAVGSSEINEGDTKDNVEQLANKIVKLNEQLDSYRDPLKCSLCFEKVVAPLLYPCKQHVACHSCVWTGFKANKVFNAESSAYTLKLSCPLCRDSADSVLLTMKMTELHKPEPLVLRLMQVNLDQQVQCPYCEYSETISHIYQCHGRTVNCHKCDAQLLNSEQNVVKHLRYVCDGFRCSKCPGQKMNQIVYSQHTSADELHDILEWPQLVQIHRNISNLRHRTPAPDPDQGDCDKYIYQMSVIKLAALNMVVFHQLLTNTTNHTIRTAIQVLKQSLIALEAALA